MTDPSVSGVPGFEPLEPAGDYYSRRPVITDDSTDRRLSGIEVRLSVLEKGQAEIISLLREMSGPVERTAQRSSRLHTIEAKAKGLINQVSALRAEIAVGRRGSIDPKQRPAA